MKTFKLMILMACVVAGVGLSGCNTVEGMGRDVENAGEAVQEAAD